tara:strand:+ start:196 stop:483 length:288 start_codon:yes stop_codon:yes gene_type:complete
LEVVVLVEHQDVIQLMELILLLVLTQMFLQQLEVEEVEVLQVLYQQEVLMGDQAVQEEEVHFMVAHIAHLYLQVQELNHHILIFHVQVLGILEGL